MFWLLISWFIGQQSAVQTPKQCLTWDFLLGPHFELAAHHVLALSEIWFLWDLRFRFRSRIFSLLAILNPDLVPIKSGLVTPLVASLRQDLSVVKFRYCFSPYYPHKSPLFWPFFAVGNGFSFLLEVAQILKNNNCEPRFLRNRSPYPSATIPKKRELWTKIPQESCHL